MPATRAERAQFTKTLIAHLPEQPAARVRQAAQSLLTYGALSCRLAEIACNRAWTEAEETRDTRNDERIQRVCRSIGVSASISGDPRGYTVKIVLPDGYTDDWGQTGLCVPTS